MEKGEIARTAVADADVHGRLVGPLTTMKNKAGEVVMLIHKKLHGSAELASQRFMVSSGDTGKQISMFVLTKNSGRKQSLLLNFIEPEAPPYAVDAR